jgi:hypothetical protein
VTRIIEFQASEVIKNLDAIRGAQLPYAGKQALSQLGWGLKQHHKEWMSSGGFEKPVPYTLASPKYAVDGLELRFFLNPDGSKGQAPATYIYPVSTENGGGRKPVYQTRFAWGIRKLGITNLHPVPYLQGKGVRTNTYGNMTPGQYQQVLAGLKTKPSTYFSKPDNRSARKTSSALKPGIYQRKGRSLFMLFGYESTLPTVQTKYDMIGISEAYISKNFPKLLSDALDRAIR